MKIKHITREEASQIIETGQPIGLFYEIDRDYHAGIDNSTGDAWVEEFTTKEECFKWLNREEKDEDLIDEKQLYMAALTKWGQGLQIAMVFEEMADVEIMLGQMKVLFDIEESVKNNKRFKLERLSERVGNVKVQVCRVCGCTQYRACEGSCYWVEEDLCSKCAEKLDEQLEDLDRAVSK